MYKKVAGFIYFLILVIIIGAFLVFNLWSRIAGYYTGFVQACSRLNGKELTHNNIKSLNGNCYLKCDQSNGCVTVGRCEEKHIQQYKEFKNKCGDPEIDMFDKTPNVYYSIDNHEPVDPYHRCIYRYLKENKSENLHISDIGTFSISQAGLDGAWVCRISTFGSKIRATPYFLDN